MLALCQPTPVFRHVYLRTSPEECFARMKKRGRSEEAGVNLDYLKKIVLTYFMSHSSRVFMFLKKVRFIMLFYMEKKR